MGNRYDHPNVLVTREEDLGVNVAGTTSVTNFYLGFQKRRLKGVHCMPTTVGTADASALIVKTISATTTSIVGTVTIGTGAVNLSASVASLALGTGNNPTGVDVNADGMLTVTVTGDDTAVSRVLIEYEILPDAVQS